MLASHKTDFLITNETRLPERHFIGNCFQDVDYISGPEGAAAFEAARGTPILPGQDGAYLVLRKTGGNRWQLGTDFKGYCHLYYYSDGQTWAVAVSMSKLLTHLSTIGVTATPDISELTAWSSNIDLVRANMTHRTSVQEITLLPSDHCLEIGPEGLAPKRIDPAIPFKDAPYGALMQDFADLWRGRIAGILNTPDIPVVTHLTGGLDSRVMFALMHSVRDLLPDIAADRFKVHSQTDSPRDHAIAEAICEAFDLPLNRNVPVTAKARHLSGYARYDFWKNAHLGSYGHTIFPLVQPGTGAVTMPGLGGECQRHVYRVPLRAGMSEVATMAQDGFPTAEIFAAWIENLTASDDTIAAGAGKSPYPMVRNHREFRDRFHSGHNLLWSDQCLPLASDLLSRASARLDDDAFAVGQCLYDLLYAVEEELGNLDFDLPSKSASPAVRGRLTPIDMHREVPIGAAFVSPTPKNADVIKDPSGRDYDLPLRYMLDDVTEAAASPCVREFLGPSFCDRGRAQIADRVEKGAQNAHAAGREAHVVMWTHQLLH